LTGQTPDLSAYEIGLTANDGTGTDFYFQTFCVAPEMPIISNMTLNGQLSYELNEAGTSNVTRVSNGTSLTGGVAWLYKEFAAGTLDGYFYNNAESVDNRVNSAVLLQDAIWFLMGYMNFMVDPDTDWDNNVYLQQLDNMVEYSREFWQSDYDFGANHVLMGDDKVFVMNVTVALNAGNKSQDVLYVIRDNSNPVPEPASILFWMLGSLGAAGAAYRKRRTQNK
jgi:hypothetical protein